MSLYAIGDLHLSLSSNKPMDVFGGGWDNYIEKLSDGLSILKPDDVCILCGDTSWGMTLNESMDDFKFIEKFSGGKIILKGNHDYWWETVTKIKAAFSKYDIQSIDILHNNCFRFGEFAICGTRGWLLETETDSEHNSKIIARETARLRTSLEAAGDAADKLVFLHYPPRYKDQICPEIVSVMTEYKVKACYYGHIHGYGHRHAVLGNVEGITYHMISADFLDFVPHKVV